MGNKFAPGTMTPPGWYSRRHQTKESHDQAVEQANQNYKPKRNHPDYPYHIQPVGEPIKLESED